MWFGRAKIITFECGYSTRAPNMVPAADAVLELLNPVFKSAFHCKT